MTSIVACPGCSSHLQMPAEAEAEAEAVVRCPICDAEFPVSRAPIQALPVAVLAVREERPAAVAAPPLDHVGPAARTADSQEAAAADVPAEMPSVVGDLPSADLPVAPAMSEPAQIELSSLAPQDADEADPRPAVRTRRRELTAFPSQDDSAHSASSASAVESHSGEATRLDSLLSNLVGDVDSASSPPREGAGKRPASVPSTLEAPISELLEDNLAPISGQPPSEPVVDALNVPRRTNPAGASGAGKFSPESASNPSVANVVDQVDLAATRRRPRWGLRILVGGVVSMLAVATGSYAALWIGGARADLFSLAAGPQFLLPPSMRSDSTVGDDSDSTGSTAGEILTAQTAADDQPTDGRTIQDSAVQPAAASAPVEPSLRLTRPASLLRNPSLCTAAELRAARSESAAAAADFLSGDLSDAEAIGRKGRAYMKHCRLIERAAFLDPADNGNAMNTELLLARNLLREATADRSHRDDLAQIASRWWQFEERPYQGILFVGRVVDLNAVGSDVLYSVEIQFGDDAIPLEVLLEKIRFHTGDVIGVAGIIVADPSTEMIDHPGSSGNLVLPWLVFDPNDQTPAGVNQGINEVEALITK